MKFTLLDANDKIISTVETLTLSDAKQVFKKELGNKYDWSAVSRSNYYYDVVIKDEKERSRYYLLTLLPTLKDMIVI